MIGVLVASVAGIFGAAWRRALGGWLGQSRVQIMILGAAFAALIIWIHGGGFWAILIAATGTVAVFSLPNAAVISGPRGGSGAYVWALVEIYVFPALIVQMTLMVAGYDTLMIVAGVVAALAYYAFDDLWAGQVDQWTIYPEIISGAAWFGLLALHIPNF